LFTEVLPVGLEVYNYKNFSIIKLMAEEKTKKKEILVLLDSHAILHRAYHALPLTFTAPDGSPTNALYGFSAFLIKVLKELKPNYIAAAYDLPEPTFRKVAFKEYKSQRKEMDDSLALQINKSKEILRAFKIPVFEFPGFEADDVLGTIVNNKKAQKRLKSSLKIIIASGDMDALQLAQKDNVVIYTLKKGINETTIYNEEKVFQRFGFSPDLIPDYKGLCGDQSDNIPGVKGIGEKTAQILIQKFGSLEEIYKTLEKNEEKMEKEGIKKRVLGLLREQKEQAFMSRALATIRYDTPIDFSFERVKNDERPKKENLIKIFEELGFRSLVMRLNEVNYFFKNGNNIENEEKNQDENSETSLFNFNASAELRGLTNIIKKEIEKQDEIFWIFENKKNAEPKISVVLKNGDYFEFMEDDFKKEKEFFKKFFSSSAKKTHYAYKAKELCHFFEKIGVEFKFKSDICIAAWLINSRLANPSIPQIFGLVGQDVYNANGIENYGKIFEVRDILLKMLVSENLTNVFYEIEIPLTSVLKKVEDNGVLIDPAKLKILSLFCEKELKKNEQQIWMFAGENFNINSTKELRRILFEKLNISEKGIRKTEGGLRSTKFSELMKMKESHPIIEEIIAYRELAKLKSTYIDALPLLIKEDGRVHTTLNQMGTVTGRLSSANPNLQNIPIKTEFGRKIREAFVAEEGFKLVSFDYSQIELRVAAFLSRDTKMISAFREGKDIHSITASEIFNTPLDKITSEMRRKAKVINFGILYGMGAGALSAGLGISRKEAEVYRNEYFNDFYGVTEYIKNVIEEARETGFVKTYFGRKRRLEDIMSFNEMLKKESERMAVNMPIQGTSADIIKIAMVRINEFLEKNKKLKDNVKMILQIHDELLFEIKEDVLSDAAEKIKNIMENIMKPYFSEIPFPVEVKIGNSWAG